MAALGISKSSMATAFAAGGIVLLLGMAASSYGTGLDTLKARESLRDELAVIAARIADEISGRYADLVHAALTTNGSTSVASVAENTSTDRNYAWWSNGNAFEFVRDPGPNLYVQQVINLISSADAPLIGPVTTVDGIDVILLQMQMAGDRQNEIIGIAIELDDLWTQSGLAQLVRRGVEATVTDDHGRTIFWTAPENLVDPVFANLHMAGRTWLLSAVPGAVPAISGTAMPTAILACLFAIGYFLWYFRLSAQPHEIRQQLSQLSARLQAKEGELSNLLQSRSRLEMRLASSLTLDLNTGLPNRTSFIEHLQNSLARCRLHSDCETIVATLQFPKIEDLGQSIGTASAQEALSAAAERVQSLISDCDLLARVGEKELAICLTAAQCPDPTQVADNLLRALDARFVIGQREFFLPAAIGFSLKSGGYEHGPELLAQSSLAATTAADSGQRWSVFSQETKDERISMLQLEADLQVAIERSELRLHFQPIVNISDKSIAGLESLLRWRHPKGSWISPERFIPLAESIGLMPQISEWVLRQAVAYAGQWLHLRQTPLYITVNLTPRDLNRSLIDHLFGLLEEYDVPTGCIRVEVTETAVVRDFKIAARLISELNERGIRVLLDDFGTGYSSLSYLRDLPFHTVKIDRSFIAGMASRSRDFGIVKSIVSLVHYLGMECVAEGIETQEQLDLVSMVNCNYGQGYLFSRPIPPSEVELLIEKGAHAPLTMAS